MLSSEIDTNLSSDFVSSTPINSITTKTDLIIAQSLPAPLAAPVGWRSLVIDPNTPLEIDNEINIINTNNNFQGYNTNNDYQGYNTNNNYQKYNKINTFNTTKLSQSSSEYLNNNTEYLNASINENTIQGYESKFTDQQQRNIVNIVEHQHPPPLIVRKTLPNNLVTYKQNVLVRYLKPPTPPPPGPLIIREVRPPPPRPQSPIQIRQRPPPPPTPPPIVLREQPPPLPPRTPSKIVEKLLPPPPPPPRRIVVERFGACPPKPSDVIIERWLPYKNPGKRPVLLERAPATYIAPQEPNLLILHDSPHARISKQFINQGVVRADPDSYLQRYGAELSSWHTSSHHGYLVDEATRAIPPPLVSSSDHHDYHTSYSDEYHRASSPYISNTWERTRVVSPIPRSASYHHGYSDYDSSDHYCNQSPHRYGYDSYRYSDGYPTHHGSYLTMTDVTPSWDSYCRSSSYGPRYRSSSYYDHDYRSSSYYDHDYRPSSYYDHYCQSSSHYPSTIRVRSEGELRHVLSDLTHGRVPTTLSSY